MSDATVDLLEIRGFTAVSANRLEEAEQLLRQYHGQIRLILLTINNASAASLAHYAFLKTHCAHLRRRGVAHLPGAEPQRRAAAPPGFSAGSAAAAPAHAL